MSDETTEAPAIRSCPTKITVGKESYEIDILQLTKRQRVWLEEVTGSFLADLFSQEGRLLSGSAKVQTAIAALAVAETHDRGVEGVLDELLDGRDGEMFVHYNFREEEDVPAEGEKPETGPVGPTSPAVEPSAEPAPHGENSAPPLT